MTSSVQRFRKWSLSAYSSETFALHAVPHEAFELARGGYLDRSRTRGHEIITWV